MDTDVVTTTAALEALRPEWEQLEELDAHAPYYVTHRFVRAWCDAYSNQDDVELHVVCARNNGRLVGVAPLSLRREKRKSGEVRVARFASHGDYLSFLLHPDEKPDAVCKRLMETVESALDWDVLALTNIPAPSPLAGFLMRSSYHPSFTLHVENPIIDLRAYNDFADFTSRHLPSKVRKYRNKLYREHDVTFRVIRGNNQDIFDRMADLHRREKRFLVEQKSRDERYSLFEDTHRTRHVRNVFTGTRDAVTFAYESPEGELLGYRTCYLHHRRLLSWNSAYHPDYFDYRIGKVIQYDVLEHLFADGSADVFDFGAGRYPWKFEWTDEFTTTYRLNLRTAREQATSTGQETPRDNVGTPPTKPPSPRRPVTVARGLVRRLGVGRVRRAAVRVRSRVTARTRTPIIWYAPHPDDETIFMGGSICQHRDRRSIVVMLTRGGGSGALDLVNQKLDRPLSRDEFIAARLRELTAAARALGIRKNDLFIHDLPDGALSEEAMRQVVHDMARRYPKAQHRTMSYLDPHRDHATAGRALRSAHQQGIVQEAVFHLPVSLVPEEWGSAVALDQAAIDGKRAALREYERWNPAQGRYAIGAHSVKKLIKDQRRSPRERVHGSDQQG
jgi:LmbE family N-acetylglucosaminyl deacetylase/CelD/BcsL family acetyltransferase involved in cellulose biosynthesis